MMCLMCIICFMVADNKIGVYICQLFSKLGCKTQNFSLVIHSCLKITIQDCHVDISMRTKSQKKT